MSSGFKATPSPCAPASTTDLSERGRQNPGPSRPRPLRLFALELKPVCHVLSTHSCARGWNGSAFPLEREANVNFIRLLPLPVALDLPAAAPSVFYCLHGPHLYLLSELKTLIAGKEEAITFLKTLET